MFPFRYSSIFKSRWIALIWAGGIMWWAASTVGPQPAAAGNDAASVAQTDALGQPVDPQQVKKIAKQLDTFGN